MWKGHSLTRTVHSQIESPEKVQISWSDKVKLEKALKQAQQDWS